MELKKLLLILLIFLLCINIVSAEKYLSLEAEETKTISFFDIIYKIQLVRIGRDAVRFQIDGIVDDIIAIDEYKKYLVGEHKITVELLGITRGEAEFAFDGIYISNPQGPKQLSFNEPTPTDFVKMNLGDMITVEGGKEKINIEFLYGDRIARYAEFRVNGRYYRTFYNDLNYVIVNNHEFIFRLESLKRTNEGYRASIEIWSDDFQISIK